jgi:hypothetical protein
MAKLQSFVGGILAVWLTLAISGCGGDHRNRSEAQAAGERVQRVLVKHGICKSMARTGDCEMWFIEGSSGGFKFTVYEIEDAKVLQEISNAVKEEFDADCELTKVTLKAWRHRSDVRIFSSEPTIFDAVFSRKPGDCKGNHP